MSDMGNSFSLAFNLLKIKYQEYDKSIDSMDFIQQNDKVNIFISFETVLKYLSTFKDLDKKMVLEKQFPTIMTADTLNLAAHYKRFFKQNNLDTNIFVYYTDLESTAYQLLEYNEDYRSYYMNKYLDNPKFSIMGEKLISRIIPEIQTICNFIPNVYFIKAKNMEGSLVPYIISKKYPNHQNFIITGDIYDTMYQRIPNFLIHFLRKSSTGSFIGCKKNDIFRVIFGNEFSDDEIILFDNPTFYQILLSCEGDKIRSIDGLKGLGPKWLIKYLYNEIIANNISNSTKSVELILKDLPDKFKNDMLNNMACFDIESQYNRLSHEDIHSIESQIIDRFDNNSLALLNSNKFFEHRLMLEELTM